MTLILAHLRPDYTWEVTPNRADGGLDFLGQQPFLNDSALGITAAIKVGGQCKKRTKARKISHEVSGSLIDMVSTVNPTFFVVAFSARVQRQKLEEARHDLERTFQRHCDILDRGEIECLMRDHVGAIEDLLRESLSAEKSKAVLDYLNDGRHPGAASSVRVAAPEQALAGVPFRVDLDVHSTLVSTPGARFWWVPSDDSDGYAGVSPPIAPVAVDSRAGVALAPYGATDDPLHARPSLEVVSYAVGDVSLGEILLGRSAAHPLERIALGRVRVVQNVRPRFFDRPFRAGLYRLDEAYSRAVAGGVAATGVVGAGGSGKSRMCEEFALEKRRRGSEVVSAKQTKTQDDPHRVLADLLSGLAGEEGWFSHRADSVINAVSRYDRSLAEAAGPAIRSLFGVNQTMAATADQDLLSALVVLLVARSRRSPLVVHLQDLHWCTTDVLRLLERLVWQSGQFLSTSAARRSGTGVLFIFEGRDRLRDNSGRQAWTSEPFEAFLQRLEGDPITCSSFEADDGLTFVRMLFEDRHSAHRLVSEDLMELQQDLIERIDRTAGGNPFHTLEQVQLLRTRRILGQNDETGLLYMIQPEPARSVLPESVFASIHLRWQYLNERTPDLALLLWACALIEDRLPKTLFRALWREIAPHVSVREVDGTDILWTGDGEHEEVVFRHENYFESLRRFEVSAADRTRAIDVYSRWFAGFRTLSPVDRFRWARVLLAMPTPDMKRPRELLASALRGARRQGDQRLARRIAVVSLDLAWDEDADSRLGLRAFLKRCDEEIELSRALLTAERSQADRRLDRLRRRLGERLASGRHHSAGAVDELQRRRLTAEVVYAQYLFNARELAHASEVAHAATRNIRDVRPRLAGDHSDSWDELEMEALHTYAVALALSGEADLALPTSEQAVAFAKRSSSFVAHEVVATHGSILLFTDPAAGERLLRDCLQDYPVAPASTEINLGVALILLGRSCLAENPSGANVLLSEARERLTRVFALSFRLGHYPDAGAAALLRGIVSAVASEGEEVAWFAQAVAAAARGQQMETLWRSHINLAVALHEREAGIVPGARDHARAALEIMEDTLSPYAERDRSPRFRLLQVSMAQAVRLLVMAGDPAGVAVLERYPALRICFRDPEAGILLEDRGGAGHGWLVRVGAADYMLY